MLVKFILVNTQVLMIKFLHIQLKHSNCKHYSQINIKFNMARFKILV